MTPANLDKLCNTHAAASRGRERDVKRPEIGDEFFPQFEDDFDPTEQMQILKIEEVEMDYGDGGFQVSCDDGISYDCYWSDKFKIWVYGL